MIDHKKIFTPQYESYSGPGSTELFSRPYRSFLEEFIKTHKIASILDLGCGDMEIMSRVNLHDARYIGIDCIEERTQRNRLLHPHFVFQTCDLREVFPTSDLVICKDVIQHWSTNEILVWLSQLVACNFKYALITNCAYGDMNADITTGGWRAIDLTKPPFSLGEIVFSWGSPNKDVILLLGPRASE